MKILLIAILLASTAYAEQKEENIAKVKEHIAASIDQRIALLQTQKSCIQNATSKDQFKICRESHKEGMKKLHQENQGKKAAWKADKDERHEISKSERKASKAK